MFVTARLRNVSIEDIEAGVSVALYARTGTTDTILDAVSLADGVASGWTSDALEFTVMAYLLDGADALWLVADDDGTGTGILTECAETNGVQWSGPGRAEVWARTTAAMKFSAPAPKFAEVSSEPSAFSRAMRLCGRPSK